jgi:hypothetical protein
VGGKGSEQGLERGNARWVGKPRRKFPEKGLASSLMTLLSLIRKLDAL